MKEADFLPEWLRQQRVRRKRLIRQGQLLAICVACMALLTCVRQTRISEARAALTGIHDRAEAQNRLIAQIAPLERQMADLLIKKQIDSELGSRTDCTAMLAELCRLMPRNMSLASLELEPVDITVEPDHPGKRTARRPVRGGGRRSAAKVIRRVRVVLTGLAPTDVDVANFIGQLSASPLLENVNMGYAKTVRFRGRSAREFQASCYLAK
jgi:Tfp pilus assembly protein PilN